MISTAAALANRQQVLWEIPQRVMQLDGILPTGLFKIRTEIVLIIGKIGFLHPGPTYVRQHRSKLSASCS